MTWESGKEDLGQRYQELLDAVGERLDCGEALLEGRCEREKCKGCLQLEGNGQFIGMAVESLHLKCRRLR